MKIYNSKEIFAMLYDDEISEYDCIEVVHPQEESHYLFRNSWGNFEYKELISCLLFKEYKFRIVNQNDAIKLKYSKERQEEIERLERRIAELKNK